MARMRRPPRTRRRRSGLLIAPLAVIVLALGAWYFRPHARTQKAEPTAPAADLEPTPIAVAPADEDSSAAAGAETPPRTAAAVQTVARAPQPTEPPGQTATASEPSGRPGKTGEPPIRSEDASAVAGPADDATAVTTPAQPRPAEVEAHRAGAVRLAADAMDDPIRLRTVLNRELARAQDAASAAQLRARLAKLAERTIFSREMFENDPLVEAYTVQPGETLIAIAKRYKVSPEIIMRINGIRDARRLRAGQRIKVPHGPFHIRIDKSDFRLDLYLQDLFVRSFKVGLGSNGGTPTGTWKVKNRLKNPTYFPPASASDKRVIPADDPTNPLGEFWIGLEGIAGEALGQEGYGIHGTIEPDSIGRNVSLGCVRMHNRDVEFVFGCVRPGESIVTIVP